MRPLKTKSFFVGEKSMDVDVACQRVTGSGLDTLFRTGWRTPTGVRQIRSRWVKSPPRSAKVSHLARYSGSEERVKIFKCGSMSQHRSGRASLAVARASG